MGLNRCDYAGCNRVGKETLLFHKRMSLQGVKTTRARSCATRSGTTPVVVRSARSAMLHAAESHRRLLEVAGEIECERVKALTSLPPQKNDVNVQAPFHAKKPVSRSIRDLLVLANVPERH